MPLLHLSPDHMEATLVLPDGETGDPHAALGLLARDGVCHGVQLDVVASLARFVGPSSHLVALGTPAHPAQDARIEYAFTTGLRELRPTIGEDDRADYRDLGYVESVQPGAILARRFPPVPAVFGTTVQGRLIQPDFPRDVLLRAGAGAAIAEDGVTLVALIAGNPYVQGGYVVVRPEIRIHGSVDLRTGHIHFEGDVSVAGDVDLQMEVRAAGSVHVSGNVSGARIIAGGDVHVSGGVFRQSHIQAGGDVVVRFMERSFVQCEGSLRVRDDLLHSEVTIRGQLVTGGTVVGGQILLGERAEMRVLGARMGTPTSVRIDAAPAEDGPEALTVIQREREKLTASLLDLSPKVRNTQAAVDRGDASPALQEALRKMLELARLFTTRDAELAERERRCVSRRVRRPQVRVREALHPGVLLQLGAARTRTDALFPACTVVETDAQVRFLPYP